MFRKLLLATILVPSAVFGSTVPEIVDSVRRADCPDRRVAIFNVDAVESEDGWVLQGKVSEPGFKADLFRALDRNGIKYRDGIAQLSTDRWGQVRIPVACMRVEPGHEQEMASQAIMGMPLRILEIVDGDYRVQTPDGYIGYMPSSSLVEKTADEMKAWRSAPRLVVTALDQVDVYSTKKPQGPRDIVTDVVNGSVLEGSLDGKEKMVHVALPDGREGWIRRSDVTEISQWASQPFDPEVILNMAYSLNGTPYLWGGTSAKTLDCSGLAKVSYLANGRILSRDASQQALTGTRMAPEQWRELQSGDLLFFGNPKTGKVTHVAIYDRDGEYIHSSGRVKVNSIDPSAADYLTTPHLSSTRIAGNENTPGIWLAKDHPWYF